VIAEGGVRVVSLADGLEVTDYDQDGIAWSSISLDSPDGRVAVLVGSAEQADQLVKAATKIRRRLAKAEACEQARQARTEINAAAAAAPDIPVHYSEDAVSLLPAGSIEVACGTAHWAVVSDDPERVSCPDCATAMAAVAEFDPGQRYDLLVPDSDGVMRPAAQDVTGEKANQVAAGLEDAEIVPHPDHVSPASPPEPRPLPEGRHGTIALIPAAAGIDPGEFHGRLVLDGLRRNPAVAGARAHMAGRKVWRQNGTAAYLRAVLAEIDSLAGAA
jgi:hypothetical protein